MEVDEIVLARYIVERVRAARGRVVTLHVSHIAHTADARGRIAYILSTLCKRGDGVVRVGHGKYVLHLDSVLGRYAKEGDILGIIRHFRTIVLA